MFSIRAFLILSCLVFLSSVSNLEADETTMSISENIKESIRIRSSEKNEIIDDTDKKDRVGFNKEIKYKENDDKEENKNDDAIDGKDKEDDNKGENDSARGYDERLKSENGNKGAADGQGPSSVCPDIDNYCFQRDDSNFFRTFSGQEFYITDLCAHVIAATNGCPNISNSTYKVTYNNEKGASGENDIYMNSIVIYLANGINVKLDSDFYINEIRTILPYTGSGVRAFKQFHYTVVQTEEVTVKFDGNKYLKILSCGESVCGMCGNKDSSESVDPSFYSLCGPSNRRVVRVDHF